MKTRNEGQICVEHSKNLSNSQNFGKSDLNKISRKNSKIMNFFKSFTGKHFSQIPILERQIAQNCLKFCLYRGNTLRFSSFCKKFKFSWILRNFSKFPFKIVQVILLPVTLSYFFVLFLIEICKSSPSVASQTIILRSFAQNKFGKKSTHFFSKI